jgi:hypothetical protein
MGMFSIRRTFEVTGHAPETIRAALSEILADTNGAMMTGDLSVRYAPQSLRPWVPPRDGGAIARVTAELAIHDQDGTTVILKGSFDPVTAVVAVMLTTAAFAMLGWVAQHHFATGLGTSATATIGTFLAVIGLFQRPAEREWLERIEGRLRAKLPPPSAP